MGRFDTSNTRWMLTPDLIMLAAGAALSLLANSMVVPAFEPIGYSAAVIISVASLLAAAAIPYRRRTWRRSLRGTGSLCLGAGVAFLLIGGLFWLMLAKDREAHVLPALIVLYGCYWSVWNLWLALHLPEFPRTGVTLSLLTQISYAVGIVLASELQFTRLTAVTALAVYATLLGLEGLIIPVYLFRIPEEPVSTTIRASWTIAPELESRV